MVMVQANEDDMLNMFTYSAFEDFHVQIYWPTCQVLVRDMEQVRMVCLMYIVIYFGFEHVIPLRHFALLFQKMEEMFL